MSRSRESEATIVADEIQSKIRSLAVARTADLRAVRRTYTRRLSESSPATVVSVARQLIPTSRFVAYELIHFHRAALRSLDGETLEKLGNGMASWDAVDAFSCFLAGPAWREGQIEDQIVHGWGLSPDRWWRRAAVVATVPLNNKTRGGRGDSARTIAVCDRLVYDRDDMVVKALSWALRELAKRHPDTVRDFMTQQGPHLAARVIREVECKLTTGRKNPTRRPN
jgi:3-methyladenine DNA glycosylase AlkD